MQASSPLQFPAGLAGHEGHYRDKSIGWSLLRKLTQSPHRPALQGTKVSPRCTGRCASLIDNTNYVHQFLRKAQFLMSNVAAGNQNAIPLVTILTTLFSDQRKEAAEYLVAFSVSEHLHMHVFLVLPASGTPCEGMGA